VVMICDFIRIQNGLENGLNIYNYNSISFGLEEYCVSYLE